MYLKRLMSGKRSELGWEDRLRGWCLIVMQHPIIHRIASREKLHKQQKELTVRSRSSEY